MKKLHRIALTSAMAALLLSGCASFWTSTDFTPYVGDDTVYFGRGGAMEVMEGVEVWKTGLPNRKYRIIGVINAESADGWQARKQLLTKVRSFIVTSEEGQHREGLLLPLGYPLIAQIAQVAGAIHVRVRAITTIRTNKPMFAALA